jgi:ABC-type uncharacterized transport system involved in gliding motility auxiliary subunit
MSVKTLSRIGLGVGLALLVSALSTLVVVPGGTALAAIQGAVGLAVVAAYFLVNRDAVGRTFAGRATLFYGVSAVTLALLVGVVVAANYVAAKKSWSVDLTKGGIFTLADDTVQTLAGLPSEVTVTAFYGEAEPAAGELRELLERYRAHTDKLKVVFVDPYQAPDLVKQKGIKEGGPRVVVEAGAREERVGELTEEALTNAIAKVLRTTEKKVYFTVGHGEGDLDDATTPDGYGSIAARLANEGLRTAKVRLVTEDLPSDAAAVLVLAPKKPFLEPELKALSAYLAKGGRVLVAAEPGWKDPGLQKLLGDWGFELDDTLIVDPLSKLMGGGDAIPVVQSYADHELTKGFDLVTLFPTARPVVARGDVEPRPVVLALTNPTAWGETSPDAAEVKFDEGEKRGALGLAAAVTRKAGDAEGRMVVFGDADFADNQFEKAGGNSDLFLNAVNWLASQEARITIRPKQREASRLVLTEEDARFLNLFSMNGLPMLVLAIGLSVWLVRRAK